MAKLNQIVPLGIKGNITLRWISKGNTIKTLEIENEVVSNGLTIIAKCLAGEDYHLNGIQAYKAGVLLAEADYFNYTFVPLNQVIFTAVFNEASFDDTLDELRLISSTGGQFSRVEGLSIAKASDVSLALDWKLTLNLE